MILLIYLFVKSMVILTMLRVMLFFFITSPFFLGKRYFSCKSFRVGEEICKAVAQSGFGAYLATEFQWKKKKQNKNKQIQKVKK